MKPNPNLYPDGGYQFTDSDGTSHRADSWSSLIRTVTEYRQRNNLPRGKPELEINAQHCAKTPDRCFDPTPKPPPKPRTISVSSRATGNRPGTLNQRVLLWLSNMIDKVRLNAVARVPDAQAAARARVCMECPRQRSLNESCASCLSGLKAARRAILKGGSRHQNLLPCNTLGEDTTISVHFDQPRSEDPDLPGACWRRPGGTI